MRAGGRARQGDHHGIVVSVLDGVGCSGPAVQAGSGLTAPGRQKSPLGVITDAALSDSMTF